MNYLLISQMRSGSSYCGDLIRRAGAPYYNELFTDEICRRSRIWPADLDDRASAAVLDLVWSVPGAGFKMIYGQATPQVWARLACELDLRIIHIIRDDLLEQYASIRYLETAGVSMARADGTLYGTDGAEIAAPPTVRLSGEVGRFRAWAASTQTWRYRVRWMFAESHPYFEIPTPHVFLDQEQEALLKFLGLSWHGRNKPDQVPTPRPRAVDMFEDFDALADAAGRLTAENFPCT